MAAAENIIKNIQTNLYLSELSFKALQGILPDISGIKAWYRASRKAQDHQNSFREVNWFLTESALIRQEINQREIFFVSFMLKEVCRIESYYDIKQDLRPDIILRRVALIFNDGKSCELTVPSLQFNGDIEGFKRLVAMLGPR